MEDFNLDEKIELGKDKEGRPICRFPQFEDIDEFEDIFTNPDRGYEYIEKQKEELPDKEDAIATMKAVFSLAQADCNDSKRGDYRDVNDQSEFSLEIIEKIKNKIKLQKPR